MGFTSTRSPTQRTVQNFGLLRGTISYTILRDCVTEAVAKIGDLELPALSEVPRERIPSFEAPVPPVGSGRDGDRDRDVGDVQAGQGGALDPAQPLADDEHEREDRGARDRDRQIEVSCLRPERQRLDERDDAGVERREVNDRSGDAAEADLGPSPTRRDREAGEFLGLDRRRQRGVAEQRLRNAETGAPSSGGPGRSAIPHRSEAPARRAAAGQAAVTRSSSSSSTSRSRPDTCQADQRHDRPDHEQSAFDA